MITTPYIGTYIVVHGPRLKFCLQNFKLRDLKLQAHTTWSATSINNNNKHKKINIIVLCLFFYHWKKEEKKLIKINQAPHFLKMT